MATCDVTAERRKDVMTSSVMTSTNKGSPRAACEEGDLPSWKVTFLRLADVITSVVDRPLPLSGVIPLLENSICNVKPSSAHADYLRM